MAIGTAQYRNPAGARRAAPSGASGLPSGFTLVEAAVCVVVVALMLVAAMNTLGGVARARQFQIRPQVARGLARQLLTEVLQAQYEDPDKPDNWGVEPDETVGSRIDFDDLDDYDAWAAKPPQAKNGAPMVSYSEWRRAVTVARVEPYGLSVIPGQDTGLRMVTVTVVDATGGTTVLSALRSRHGAGENPPGQETTCVRWAGVELETQGSGRIDWGVVLLNEPRAE